MDTHLRLILLPASGNSEQAVPKMPRGDILAAMSLQEISLVVKMQAKKDEAESRKSVWT